MRFEIGILTELRGLSERVDAKIKLSMKQKGEVTMSILKVNEVSKVYGTKEQLVHALNHVNLEVNKGEFVAIVGTSGSGKSTLLHLLGGLDTATKGQVYLNGHDLSTMKADELTIYRR